MSRILYQYDPKTGLLISSFTIEPDVKASKDGKEVYFCPPNTTFVAPDPNFKQAFRIQKFDVRSNSWIITDDFRGCKVANKNTKEIVVWDKLGPLPKDYTMRLPEDQLVKYVEWGTTGWVLSEQGRTDILDDIWSMRKMKREKECSSDLEYNGHMIHVDATSFNDIMLAAQEAMISEDMTTTKRWVTADNVDVQLNGNDFIAIARLFGSRRQDLVYRSNEAWQEDTQRTDEELIDLYKRLMDEQEV